MQPTLRVYQGFWKMFHVLIEAGPQLHQHDIVIHGGVTELLKGAAECGKETNALFFFFRGLLDTPPPSTFLIEYVFPRLMSFFFFNSEDLRVTSKLITGGWPTFDVD